MRAGVRDITLPTVQEMTLTMAVLARRGVMIFDSAWVESLEKKGKSIWRVLALAKVQTLTEPKQERERIMGPVEV
jgi:hypothetical protein